MYLIRYPVFAQEAASVGGDEDVVLDADASEVLVGLELVEVEELGAVSRAPPFVDEGRDEVDAGFVRDDKALLQAASHAQAIGAELFQVWPHLVVEADVGLSEPLHVVHVHAHHVSQAVGH